MMPRTTAPGKAPTKRQCPFCGLLVEAFLYDPHLLTIHGLLLVNVPKFTGGSTSYYVWAYTEEQVKKKVRQDEEDRDHAVKLEHERQARLKELEKS